MNLSRWCNLSSIAPSPCVMSSPLLPCGDNVAVTNIVSHNNRLIIFSLFLTKGLTISEDDVQLYKNEALS